MKLHRKKIIAPLVITILLVIYYMGFSAACILMKGLPLAVKLLGTIIPLILAGGCIYVLVERIREIRSGEEDDLSNY